MRDHHTLFLVALILGGCSAGAYDSAQPNTTWSSADMGSATGSGSFSNVGIGGGQDFASFRAALDANKIPTPAMLDANGFFAEHYTSLPAPTCAQTFCLHALLAVSPDLLTDNAARTTIQIGMNSSIDPDKVAKPPLDLVVVLDRSGSMLGANKIDYAKQGLHLLVDQLADSDRLTFITFSDVAETRFGPAPVSGQRASLHTLIDGVVADGGTNLFDALQTGYQAALAGSVETEQRRILFLTDGVATVGNSNGSAILAMSKTYNEKYLGLTTIGLGVDADNVLLRSLAEQGGGNFYFLEQPQAVTEVFTQELKFFVAPIAYDVQVDLNVDGAYTFGSLVGTHLWKPMATGGNLNVPSVFLVSRQSSAPDVTGGRRGGGSAMLADVTPKTLGAAGPAHVASVDLSYRVPGHTDFEHQHVDVTYDGAAGVVPADAPAGWFGAPSLAKNDFMLAFYRAFETAVNQADKGDRAAALATLQAFRTRAAQRLLAFTDADLADDLHLVERFITVLQAP